MKTVGTRSIPNALWAENISQFVEREEWNVILRLNKEINQAMATKIPPSWPKTFHLNVPTIHEIYFEILSISPNEEWIIANGFERQHARHVTVYYNRRSGYYYSHKEFVQNILFSSADSNLLVIVTNTKVSTWNLGTNPPSQRVVMESGAIIAADISQDGRFLVALDYDDTLGTVTAFSLIDQSIIQQWRPAALVSDVRFLAVEDERYPIAINLDGESKWISDELNICKEHHTSHYSSTPHIIKVNLPEDRAIWKTSIDAGTRRILLGSREIDNDADSPTKYHLYSNTGKLMSTWEPSRNQKMVQFTDLSMNPSCTFACTRDNPTNQCSVWNMDSGKCVISMPNPELQAMQEDFYASRIIHAVLSPSGKHIICLTRKGTITFHTITHTELHNINRR